MLGALAGVGRALRGWQGEPGKLMIFPAGPCHIHRPRVNATTSKTIATGSINAGSGAGYLQRLAGI